MDRINHLNKIKEYEKQIKQKCKMHRQVSYGYTTTSNPVKRQLAKSIQQPIRDKSLGLARERVEDPYMYSIQLAQNRQLNDYVFKNTDIFLTNIKTEQDKKPVEEEELTQELLAQGWRIQYDEYGSKVYVNANMMISQEEYPTLRHHQTPATLRPLTEELISQGWIIAKNAYGESIYFNTVYDIETYAYPSTEQITQEEEELSQQTEEELTPELIAAGWRRIEDPITKNYMYINIQKGGVPQTEYPTITQTVPVGKPKITLYTSRGQTYYVNSDTNAVTRTLPEGFTEDDVITSTITEPEESQRFINYYKPKFNTRVRGDRVIPDSGLRDALRNDINKIYLDPTVLNIFNDYRYLLNKDVIETSSRKELVKQYKSILNIIAQHEAEMPRNFEAFASLTQEFNKARRNETAVNVDHNDEIEQSTQSGEPVEPDKYDYIRFRQDLEEMLESGVNKEGDQLTADEIYKLKVRLETIVDHMAYTDMLIMLKNDLASGVASDGKTPLTQEQIDIFNERIANLEQLVKSIDERLQTIPADPTDLTATPPPPPPQTPTPTPTTTPTPTATPTPTPTPEDVLNNLFSQREKYRNMLKSNTDESGAPLTQEQVNHIRVSIQFLNQNIQRQQALFQEKNKTASPPTQPPAPADTEIGNLPTNTTDPAYDPDGRELAEP